MTTLDIRGTLTFSGSPPFATRESEKATITVRRSWTATALILPLLVIGANTAPSSTALQRTAAGPVAIPFEVASHHIIVKVTVNKSRPLSFVLDTGANLAIVRMDAAKELKLSLEGSVNAGGAGAGTQIGARVKNATWSLVGLEGFAQSVALALPLAELPFALGREVDGIIGGEFIKQFVVELDYQASLIRLHDRAAFAYSGRGDTLPLEFNSNGHPVVHATVTLAVGTPIKGQFLLDIGSGFALALHSPFVAEHNLPGSQSKTVRAIGMRGAGGQSTGRLGRVTALQIGSFMISSPITLFSEDTAGAFSDRSLAGNIGAQIASRFRTYLDYGRRRIILEPSSTFAEPFDRALSGMAVRGEGPDYRTFRITEVLEESPAAEAGIEAGDVITSIDGVAAESLTLGAITEMFEKPVAREITIRREGQLNRTTLTPRTLF